ARGPTFRRVTGNRSPEVAPHQLSVTRGRLGPPSSERPPPGSWSTSGVGTGRARAERWLSLLHASAARPTHGTFEPSRTEEHSRDRATTPSDHQRQRRTDRQRRALADRRARRSV